MRTITLALVSCVCTVLLACKMGGDEKAGTTDKAAAEALTLAASFEGGELIDGLLPPSTDPSVSLSPFESSVLEPGADSLMSFELVPGDADASLALVQFGEAEKHFEIVSSAFGGEDAADGGSAGAGAMARRIELAYSIAKNVCAKLCDRAYELDVFQAVRAESKKVSKHATAKVTLDCREEGDHDACGKADEQAKAPANTEKDAGTRSGSDASTSEQRDSATADPLDAALPFANDASVRGDAGMAGDLDASLAQLDPTGVWVSDYNCALDAGPDAYWVVWKISGSGSSFTIDDGVKQYQATLAGSLLDVKSGVTSIGTLDFVDNDHFTGTFDESGTICSEVGRRAPGLDLVGASPTCVTAGTSNVPACTDICDAVTTCAAPACTCAAALTSCAAELSIWQDCLDAEGISTPTFACSGSLGYESTSCWAEWDLCVVGNSCL